MTCGVFLLLVSLGALLLGLCSGAQLRSELRNELRNELLNTNPACGSFPGLVIGSPPDIPYPRDWFKVLVCSGDSDMVILQDTDSSEFFWVVDSVRNAVIDFSKPGDGMCYPTASFSVKRAQCPVCPGSWVQRDFKSTTGESKECVPPDTYNTTCGSGPGAIDWYPPRPDPYPGSWLKMLVCSSNSKLMILQRPHDSRDYWVVNSLRNATISNMTPAGEGMCYSPDSFSVMNAPCPDCSGSWVQRDFSQHFLGESLLCIVA
jgi:hypothetical protein